MPEPGTAFVCVRDLTKRYGAVEAARGATFEVAEGEVFGLLGRNGAGKTTILECLLGLRRPDSGQVEIGGIDALAHPQIARARVGAQIQLASLQDKITVREALELFGSFYGDPAPPGNLIERFELSGKADAPFDSLSGGQRQRLFLALAFVNRPRLVVLDEPTAGLDVPARRKLARLIRGLRASGETVLMSTHHLDEAHELCDRIAILDEGRIAAMGSPAELVARGGRMPRLVVRTAKGLAPAAAAAIPEVASFRVEGDRCWLETSEVGGAVAALVKRLEADGNRLLEIQIEQPSLEEVFVKLTGRPWSDSGDANTG